MTPYMVVYREDDGNLECVFSGRLDTSVCANIEKELKERVQGAGGNIVFDIRAVDFIASSFLRFCIISVKTAGEEKFSVTGATPELKKIFTVAGMEQLLE